MEQDGDNLGAGTDGTTGVMADSVLDGTTGAMVVLDGTTGDTVGTGLFMVTTSDMRMVMVTDIFAITIDIPIDGMPLTIPEEAITQDRPLTIPDFLLQRQEAVPI